MDVLLILLVLCVLAGVGTGPWWGYHHMGYYPPGIFWMIAIGCLVVWLIRRREL